MSRKHIAIEGKNKGQLVQCVAKKQCGLGGDINNHIKGNESPDEMVDKVRKLAEEQGLSRFDVADMEPYDNQSDNEAFVEKLMNSYNEKTNVVSESVSKNDVVVDYKLEGSIPVKELTEEDNKSGLSLESLNTFADSIDDSIDSLNWNKETGQRDNRVGIVPTRYDTDSNSLVGFLQDPSGELIDVEIPFDDEEGENASEEGEDDGSLTIHFSEGMESRTINKDAARGSKEIRESLDDIFDKEIWLNSDDEYDEEY